VIPAAFDYVRATSVDEVVALLGPEVRRHLATVLVRRTLEEMSV
jgi:hypothetical protein